MATITVSSNANLATLGYSAGDDIVITSAAVLTVNSDPTAINAPRSIRSSSPRASFVVRNTATAFSAGNLWKLSFTNPGSAIGAGNATLGFTSGATLDIQGEWLECYTATGVANETVLDASNVLGVDIDFPYFIEAETAAGSGVWKAVPVAVVGGSGGGFLTTVATSAFGTGDVGRVLFYDWTTRLLKTGDGTNGSLFASGVKFRIPNIYIHMPAFTMTVAAGGWTTATGAQNVVSSTGAPILGAGNVNWTMGVECFNISATPTGTTVTVNNRASDGTTATAHAAAQVMYALPHLSATMAGQISCTSNGIVKLRKCMFGRWLMPRIFNGAQWDMEDTGFVSQVDGNGVFFNSMNGLCRAVRGAAYGNPGRGVQVALRATAQAGKVVIDGVLNIAQCAAVSTSSFNANSTVFQANSVYTLDTLSNVRVWRLGMTAAMNAAGQGVNITASTPALTAEIPGLELVGLGALIQVSNCDITGVRYSQTNGAASTAITTAAISFGTTALTTDLVFRDFDVINGGTAPYMPWFEIGTFCKNIITHNKVSGTVRSIDCQARTSQIFSNVGGGSNIAGAMSFTNMRGSGQAQVPGFIGLNNIVRNLRASHTSGNVIGQGGMTLDFPPGPQSPNGINSYSDGGTFYAAPNTYPSLVGGIYLGPVSREQDIDQYDLTAGAYTNNGGDFFIETTGDAVLFKSPKRITGVSSITGSAVVYVSHSNITTGVTAEFRLCKWGDDITAVSWGSFTAGNVQTAFNALSGYTSAIGLNFQLRFTATTTVAGRFIRQCYVPCQMDTAYNPAVGSVTVTAVGAEPAALMALYVGSSLWATTTTDGSGEGSVQAPYDFDDVAVAGTLKIRALEAESIDLPVSWVGDGANVPAPMAALTGYTAGPYPDASFDKGTKTVTVSAAMTADQLWSAWREYIVQLANFDVDDDWSYPELNAGTWAVAFSGAGAVTGSYTDRDGTRAPITAPNLPTGTRVQFYDVTGAAELLNTTLASPGASTSLYFTTTKTIRLRASKLGSLPIEAFGVITASGLTFIDEFVDDDVYIAKGIDGSTVTEFSADEPNVQIDSNDPDGTSSVWRCYAWFRYYETSSIGAAGVLFGAATAVDTENLAIDSARADIQLDNVSGVPLKISDGYMYRTDGATIIAPTSGSIQMDPKKAYAAPAADLLLAELETGYDVGRALRIIAAAVAGKTSGGPTGFVARNLSDTADQIAGTSDASGNRSSATYGS